MRTSLLLPVLLTAATASPADEVFTSHPAFYAHVAASEQWRQAFDTRPQLPPPPGSHGLALHGLAPAWGRVELREGGIVIDGRYRPWPTLQESPGMAAKPRIDLDLARVAEGAAQAGQPPRVCVQSPAGSSGSAARWQHVIVIERRARAAPPRMAGWFAPYASCEAVFIGPAGELIAGAFAMQFESEQAIGWAIFNLQDLRSPARRLPRYAVHLREPGNAFEFTATRIGASSAGR